MTISFSTKEVDRIRLLASQKSFGSKWSELELGLICALSNMFPVVWRDDGEKFAQNDDNTYSMVSSEMVDPYRYTLRRLLSTRSFALHPPK